MTKYLQPFVLTLNHEEFNQLFELVDIELAKNHTKETFKLHQKLREVDKKHLAFCELPL